MTRLLRPYHHVMYRLHSTLPRLLRGAMYRLPVRDGVAITIDDGPTGQDVAPLLAACAEHDLRCTFFLSGDAVRRHPRQAEAIAAAGHEIGSHGFLHRSVLRLPDAALRDDVRRSLDVIADATGERPRLYRPPYGRIMPRQLGLLRAFGVETILWTALPGDWNDRLPAHVLRGRLSALTGGDIVVLHDRPGGQQRLIGHLRHVHRVLRAKDLRTHTLLQYTGVQ